MKTEDGKVVENEKNHFDMLSMEQDRMIRVNKSNNSG